jgi:hypothetical protein
MNEMSGPQVPGFWMNETNGVLRPAVTNYLTGLPMSDREIAAMRGYLRQWINAPGWIGPMIDVLRSQVGEMTSRKEIKRWLDRAADAGIDPL